MKTIEFHDGKKLQFEEFPTKDENLRKINIHVGSGESEGLWAFFSDEGIKKYAADYRGSDYDDVVILANAAIMFYPQNSWGLYVPIKYNGAGRATCDCSKLAGYMIFCQERLDADEKNKKKTKKKK